MKDKEHKKEYDKTWYQKNKERAKKQGKHLGRPAIPPTTVTRIRELREEGLSYRKIAKRTGVSICKISRIVRGI